MQGLSYLPLTKWLTCFAGSNIFFLYFIQKNKICNSCFLAKTKREGNEIVVLCWFCQNFSKVHSKCVREKTPLKVDPLEKKLCVFFKRPFDEFLWDKLSIKLQKNEYLVNLVLLPELKYYDISLIDLSTKYFLRYNF